MCRVPMIVGRCALCVICGSVHYSDRTGNRSNEALMRRFLIRFTVMLALATAAQAETVLRLGLREDPDLLDPTLGSSYVGRVVYAGMCDKLFDIDEKLRIVPQLATGYEYPDATHLVIHLRPNVTFH